MQPMEDKNEIRSLSSEDLATLLHGGLADRKDTAFTREIYLCEAKIYGLRDETALKEYLSRASVGDVVRLYRRIYGDTPADSTQLSTWIGADDGHSIRIHTMDGGCFGYMQPPNEFGVAEFMLAGKDIYAKISYINMSEPFDRREAVRLKVYWVIKSNPLTTDLTVGEPRKDELIVKGSSAGDILLHRCSFFISGGIARYNDIRDLEEKERLIARIKSREDSTIVLETEDGVYRGESTDFPDIVLNLLRAGKVVYGVVEGRGMLEGTFAPWKHAAECEKAAYISIDVYLRNDD